MANIKKTVAWVAIGAIAIAGTYFIIKGIKQNKELKSGEGQDEKISLDKTVIPQNVKGNGSIYPLKKGSRGNKGTPTGDAIRLLQLNIGAGVDGIWGNETDKLLKEKTGKTQIDSEADLQSVISQINSTKQTQSAKSERYNRSWDIIRSLTKGFSNIKIKETSYWQKIAKDNINNSYYNEPTIMNLKKGQKLSLTDYLPISTLNNGNLVIECFSGANKGLWETDPTTINLV